jgi:hypothetical protein
MTVSIEALGCTTNNGNPLTETIGAMKYGLALTTNFGYDGLNWLLTATDPTPRIRQRRRGVKPRATITPSGQILAPQEPFCGSQPSAHSEISHLTPKNRPKRLTRCATLEARQETNAPVSISGQRTQSAPFLRPLVSDPGFLGANRKSSSQNRETCPYPQAKKSTCRFTLVKIVKQVQQEQRQRQGQQAQPAQKP